MIWLWILLAALGTVGGIFWLGKLPAASRPLAGAAVRQPQPFSSSR